MSEAPLARPKPFGTNERGSIPLFRGEDIAVYRLLRGVSQEDVASRLRRSQGWATRIERDPKVQAKQAVEYLDAVDNIVARREAMRHEGEARRDGTWGPVPYSQRGKWRTAAEAAAIKKAQAETGHTS